MERTASILVASLLSIGAIHAQEDTARVNRARQQQENFRASDMAVVQPREIPRALREILQDEKYKGWENSPVYQNRVTGDYVIQVLKGIDVPKIYYFNQKGERKEYLENNNEDMPAYNKTDSVQNESRPETTGNIYDPALQTDRSDQDSTNAQASQYRRNQSSQSSQSTTGNVKDPALEQDRSDPIHNSNDKKKGREERTNKKGMLVIEPSELPAALKETLKEEEYQGWESSSTIFRNPRTGDYMMVMSGDDGRTYYFDKNGKRKTMTQEMDR